MLISYEFVSFINNKYIVKSSIYFSNSPYSNIGEASTLEEAKEEAKKNLMNMLEEYKKSIPPVTPMEPRQY